MERVRQWSLAQLSADDQTFIAAFAPKVTIPLAAERALLCFHGTPTSFDEILLPSTPSEEVRRVLDPYAPAILTGGHTHLQQIRQLSETFFFNPGSVGLVGNYELPEERYRREPWVEYAILSATDGVISLEFRRIPLPMEALREALATSGHPDAERVLHEYGL
jgi:predicted phosphodiesterase